MSSVPKKTVTVKSDIWFVDNNAVKSLGFQESPHFGTEWTKFYWRAEKLAHHYKLHLYLAAYKEKKIQVDMKLSYRPNDPTISELSLSREISLDKTHKIGWDNWGGGSYFTLTELTFEETDFATIVTQQKHYEALSRQLATLRLDSSSADITLVTTVDGRKFSAHKVILASRSAVFAAMFQHDTFVENKKNRVEIDDVTGEVMDALLRYIYSADLQGIEKMPDKLLQVADKYDIPLLVEACIDSLLKNLTIDTAAKFFYLTDLYRLEDAKKSVTSFIAKNRQTVHNSAGWNPLIGPEQLEQLYTSML